MHEYNHRLPGLSPKAVDRLKSDYLLGRIRSEGRGVELTRDQQTREIIEKGLAIFGQGHCIKGPSGGIIRLTSDEITARGEDLGTLSTCFNKLTQINHRTTAISKEFGDPLIVAGKVTKKRRQLFTMTADEFLKLCATYKVTVRDQLETEVEAVQAVSPRTR